MLDEARLGLTKKRRDKDECIMWVSRTGMNSLLGKVTSLWGRVSLSSINTGFPGNVSARRHCVCFVVLNRFLPSTCYNSSYNMYREDVCRLLASYPEAAAGVYCVVSKMALIFLVEIGIRDTFSLLKL